MVCVNQRFLTDHYKWEPIFYGIFLIFRERVRRCIFNLPDTEMALSDFIPYYTQIYYTGVNSSKHIYKPAHVPSQKCTITTSSVGTNLSSEEHIIIMTYLIQNKSHKPRLRMSSFRLRVMPGSMPLALAVVSSTTYVVKSRQENLDFKKCQI